MMTRRNMLTLDAAYRYHSKHFSIVPEFYHSFVSASELDDGMNVLPDHRNFFKLYVMDEIKEVVVEDVTVCEDQLDEVFENLKDKHILDYDNRYGVYNNFY